MSGLRLTPSVDLVADIHRQRRRTQIRRVVQIVTLVVVSLSLAYVLDVAADRRDVAATLASARQQYAGGTALDMQSAVALLSAGHARHPGDVPTREHLMLARAHLALEFLHDPNTASTDEDAPPGPARTIAEAITAFTAGDLDAAHERIAGVDPNDPRIDAFAAEQRAWLLGLLAVARPELVPIATAEPELRVALERTPGSVPLRRVLARVLAVSGRSDDALAELDRARAQSRTHLGLAADEAIYNASLHRELSGVASVADQLLAREHEGLSPRDRAHARLARAVAHVRSGEPAPALALLDEAWNELPPWDRSARELAIVTALEAGDATRLSAWLPESGLSPIEQDIRRAFGTLLEGRVMTALDALERLPQAHPLVGYLQALALVEQGRFAEAKPWVERSDRLLPGRTELEVARARVDLRLGDAAMALRRLKALAEEEPYAPRAWTGLGEAYLLQDARDPRAAREAFLRAASREKIPAEALLQLGLLASEQQRTDPQAGGRALERFEQAARENPHLPRYRSQLAMHLADLHEDARALELLRTLSDERGIEGAVLVQRVRLELANGHAVDSEALLTRASELGVPPRVLERERAYVELTRGTREALTSAVTRLERLLAEDEADVDARVLHVRALARLFDRAGAKNSILRGLALTPDAAEGRLHLALAELEARSGHRVRAAPRARRAWVMMRDEARPARELLEVADLTTDLWIRNKQDRVALTIARDLTARLAFHAEAWTLRARTELAAGETTDARESAEQALSLDPNRAAAHVILGHCLLRFGHEERAEAEYQRAIALAAGTPEEAEIRHATARR